MRILRKFFEECYRHRVMYAVVLVFGMMSVFDIALTDQYKMQPLWQAVFITGVAALKATVIMVPLVVMLRNKYTRIAAYVLVALYGLLSITNLVSYAFYDFGITRKLILIAAQTTPAEFSGFMPQVAANIGSALGNPWLWVGVLLIAGLIAGAKYIRRKAFAATMAAATLLGIIAFGIFSFNHASGRTAVSLTLRIAKYGREVYLWDKKYKEMQAHKPELLYPESVKSDFRAQTVVVVIGESASRSHHSLYGYPLPTTPSMDAMADSLFAFTNAIGSSAATSGNMERILSFKPDDQTCGDGLDYTLLIDVFEKAGYKTFWLSNQERNGQVSNTSGVMASGASVVKYMGAETAGDALSMKFDGVLFPEFEEALRDTAAHKLIFLHLLGSHVDYSIRYPSNFARFKASDELKSGPKGLSQSMAQTRAEYDNSILYTDWLLSRIATAVGKEKKPALMIYFSDHGENVYDEGKIAGRGPRFVEVPFIVYPNRNFRLLNPDITDRMGESTDRKFSTANFVHMLLTLTGTSYRQYDAGLDVLSPAFKPRPRYVDEKLWPYE